MKEGFKRGNQKLIWEIQEAINDSYKLKLTDNCLDED